MKRVWLRGAQIVVRAVMELGWEFLVFFFPYNFAFPFTLTFLLAHSVFLGAFLLFFLELWGFHHLSVRSSAVRTIECLMMVVLFQGWGEVRG